MLRSWFRLLNSLSTPLLPEVALKPLSPEAELTPLVVDRVEIVLAALEPLFSPRLLIFANGNKEFLISARAFL